MVSLVLVLASVMFMVVGDASTRIRPPRDVLATPTGPGDPVLAAKLAEQADQLSRSDPMAELQLRLAANTLDPDNAGHRSALAQLLLGPRPLATLGTSVGPIACLAFGDSGRLAVGGQSGVQATTDGDPSSMTVTAPLPDDLADVSAVAYADAGRVVVAASGGTRVLPGSGTTGPRNESPAGEAPAAHALTRLGTSGWAATTRDGRLVVWDRPIPAGPASRTLADGLGLVAPLAATPDGRYLFAPATGGVAVWDVSSGIVATTISLDGAVTALAVGGQGRWLLVGHGAAATLWDISQPVAPRRGATLQHPGAAVTTTAVAPDGRTMLTAGAGTAVVWELSGSAPPTLVAALPVGGAATVGAAYNQDSTILATGAGTTVQMWSVAELLVYRPAQVQPAVTLRANLDVPEPITYAMTNPNGSYLLTSGTSQPAYVWSTRETGREEPTLGFVKALDAPVRGANAVGDLQKTTMVALADTSTASTWLLISPGIASRRGQLAEAADTAAVTPDGNTAIVVTGTTATVWDLVFGPTAKATLSYPLPTTVLAFAPQGTVLIAGHADGSVTVHTIELSRQSAGERHLTSEAGPVDAVALSASASTALAVHRDGAISVWGLRATTVEATAMVSSAVDDGPHQAWLSPTGDFAIVSDASGRATLWSLVDAQHPNNLATLVTGDTAVPVIISADGSTALQISRENTLIVWNLQPVLGVVANPTARACQLANLGHERWRAIVSNMAFNTPCLPPPLPALDGSETATPTPSAESGN
jgi:WD40 repeat protein